MNISLVQPDLYWENKNANLAHLEELIQEIGGTDLIVLPEMFNTGFTMNSKRCAEPMNLHTCKWLQGVAQSKNTHITGSAIISENGNYYNRMLWAKPSGEISYYDKKHLFRMGEENEHFSAGEKQLEIAVKDWKLRLAVCYDLRFPVWLRNNKKPYDILVVVANWPASRNHVWETLLKARAIENQCYVVGVNRIGVDGRDISYCGNSMFIDPKGNIIKSAGDGEVVLSAYLDLKVLNEFRSKFPVHLDADSFQILH